jgi:hypothetical protein
MSLIIQVMVGVPGSVSVGAAVVSVGFAVVADVTVGFGVAVVVGVVVHPAKTRSSNANTVKIASVRFIVFSPLLFY